MEPKQLQFPKVEDLPGYRDALKQEERIRLLSLIRDVPEFIEGIEVDPLTFEHINRLHIAGSPFISGSKSPGIEDVWQFLWCLSPMYRFACDLRSRLVLSPWRARRAFNSIQRRFTKQVASRDQFLLLADIVRFVDDAFMDSPGRSEAGFMVPYYAGQVSIMAILATEFGWSYSEIEKMPVKVVFQFLKWIIKQKNPNAILFNRSDKVRREAIEKLKEASNG